MLQYFTVVEMRQGAPYLPDQALDLADGPKRPNSAARTKISFLALSSTTSFNILIDRARIIATSCD